MSREENDDLLSSTNSPKPLRRKISKQAVNKAVTKIVDRSCFNCNDILVVDDDSFNILALKALLKSVYQISCDEATNGEEAVERVTKNLKKTCCNERYKIIFMDGNMPIMDGF